MRKLIEVLQVLFFGAGVLLFVQLVVYQYENHVIYRNAVERITNSVEQEARGKE